MSCQIAAFTRMFIIFFGAIHVCCERAFPTPSRHFSVYTNGERAINV